MWFGLGQICGFLSQGNKLYIKTQLWDNFKKYYWHIQQQLWADQATIYIIHCSQGGAHKYYLDFIPPPLKVLPTVEFQKIYILYTVNYVHQNMQFNLLLACSSYNVYSLIPFSPEWNYNIHN